VNQYSLVVAWDCATANVPDNTFQGLMRQFAERMMLLSDTAFHAAEGDPVTLKLCRRGEWEDRSLVETVLAMLTLVCHVQKVMHRRWAYFQARLAFTMARLQCAGPVVWLPTQRLWLRAPLDCRIWSVKD
jgi:hypothetical protein